jgi:hypothetical protein
MKRSIEKERAPYRRGDTLRDPHGLTWRVLSVEGQTVTLEAHGAMRREIEAERLAGWERIW